MTNELKVGDQETVGGSKRKKERRFLGTKTDQRDWSAEREINFNVILNELYPAR